MGKRKGATSPKPAKAAKVEQAAGEGDFLADLETRKPATLSLADGTEWSGYSFGADTSMAGEVRMPAW